VLSWATQWGWLAKALGMIRICPFKALKPRKEGWSRDDLGCSDQNPSWTNFGSLAWEAFESTWG